MGIPANLRGGKMSGAETSVLVAVALGIASALTIVSLIMAVFYYFIFRIR
jgi:hypothetical protein